MWFCELPSSALRATHLPFSPSHWGWLPYIPIPFRWHALGLGCSSKTQASTSSHSQAMVLPSSEFLPHPSKASLELNRLAFQIVSLLKSPPAKLAFLGLESPRRIFFQLNLMTWDLWEQEMGAALSTSWPTACIIFGMQSSAHPTLRSVILKAHCSPVFSSLSSPWFSPHQHLHDVDSVDLLGFLLIKTSYKASSQTWLNQGMPCSVILETSLGRQKFTFLPVCLHLKVRSETSSQFPWKTVLGDKIGKKRF